MDIRTEKQGKNIVIAAVSFIDHPMDEFDSDRVTELAKYYWIYQMGTAWGEFWSTDAIPKTDIERLPYLDEGAGGDFWKISITEGYCIFVAKCFEFVSVHSKII